MFQLTVGMIILLMLLANCDDIAQLQYCMPLMAAGHCFVLDFTKLNCVCLSMLYKTERASSLNMLG